MQAARLIGAFIAQRTHVANVARLAQPDSRERQPFVDETLHEAAEDHIEGALFGECK